MLRKISLREKARILRAYRKGILLMVFCTIFTSLGQILWKMGVERMVFGDVASYFNLTFVLGFISYGVGATFIVVALENGELSVLYPIVATSYVWVSLISPYLFHDFMNLWKWIGVFLILISVSLLGFSGPDFRLPKLRRKQYG